jgi:endonuclease YncB( thermonuclease family)
MLIFKASVVYPASKLKTALYILALVLATISVSNADQFRVIRVTDGDTIAVVTNGKEITVNYVGIDASELPMKKHLRGQPFSLKAKEHLADYVLNQPVTLKSYGKDRYDRSLVEVFVDGINVNFEMVKAGMAEVDRGKPVKGLDIEMYRDAERVAKEKALGIWELRDQYFSPRDWREMYGLED